MSRPEGLPKTGGRQAGTPNRRTTELEMKLNELGIDPIEKLAELIPTLEVDAQVDVMLALLPYVYPKRKTVAVTYDPPEENSRLIIMLGDSSVDSSSSEL